MGSRTSLQFDPGRQSINDFLRQLDDLGKPQRTLGNSIVRGLSYTAAQRLVPLVQRGVASSPAPQAAALSRTVRAKRDRMIVIRVGATNPRLSGFRRGQGRGTTRSGGGYKGALAWGVEKGNYPGTRDEYGIARRGSPGDLTSGHGVGRVSDQLLEQAGRAYADIIIEVVRRNGFPTI